MVAMKKMIYFMSYGKRSYFYKKNFDPVSIKRQRLNMLNNIAK